MANYDVELKSEGAAFANKYKDNPKKPDYVGQVEINKKQIKAMIDLAKSDSLEQAEIKIAMWDRVSKPKDGKEGQQYYYISVEVAPPGMSNPAPAPAPAPEPKKEEVFDDEIPF
jgi:hypothetical protein